MSIDGTPTTPEGWYPDPDGTAKSRWWDGSAWTEHYHDPSAPVHASSAPVGPAVIAAVPVEPAVPGVTSPYNLWVWYIVGLVGLSFLTLVTFDFQAYVFASLYNAGNPFAIFTPGYVFVSVVGFLTWAGAVALAYFDHRDLRARGVAAPFHWAFAFISSVVYLAGRSIVIRRRLGNGMVPLWVAVGYAGGVVILVIAWIASTISIITQNSGSFS